MRSVLVLLATIAAGAAAFVAPVVERRRSSSFASSRPLRSISGSGIEGGNEQEDAFSSESTGNFYDDFGELSPSSSFTSSGDESSPPPPVQQQQQSSSSISAAPDPSLFQSLQERRRQLEQSSSELLERWSTGSVRSFPAFTLNEQFYRARQEEQEGIVKYGTNPGWYNDDSNSEKEEEPFDWVRRIGIGTYPRVACGSAHGSVYVADVRSRTVLGVARNAHSSRHVEGSVDALDERLRGQLYGEYDGGGVLAVAMHGAGFVASAGREGGVKLFQLGGGSGEGELKYVADVPSLKRPLPGVTPVLVTCLEFDSLGRLYVGGQDGFLRMVAFTSDFGLTNDPGTNADEMKVTIVSSPRDQMQRSPVLSLVVSEELDMVATAHANGNMCVHSMHQEGDDADGKNDKSKSGGILGIWNPFSSESSARSVAFVSGGEDGEVRGSNDPLWSIVVGGGNGELWMQEIHPSRIPTTAANGDVDIDSDGAGNLPTPPLFKEDSIRQIKPSHEGPILSLATRSGGILVSAGQGGVLCVTQLWPAPRALYGLGGYKVWIGDVCIDAEGKRLLSDGRDDVVVVHDFSVLEEGEEDGK